MCSSLTLITKDQKSILARTLDFASLATCQIYMIPRNYIWFNPVDSKGYRTDYAIVGLGVHIDDLDKSPILLDGMNEKGLMCAALWLEEARYTADTSSKVNLKAYNLVFWMLSQYTSVSEVIYNFKDLNLLGGIINLIGGEVALHWIISDASGMSIVIEQTQVGTRIFENKIGVLTNSPTYDVHIKNLSRYLPYNKEQFIKQNLPGDFSPKSRFVRTALLRMSITDANTEKEGVTNAYKILQNVAVKDETVRFDNRNQYSPYTYTLYTTVMCAQSGKYYVTTYQNQQIQVINLFHENLNRQTIKVFELKKEQEILLRN